MRTARTGVWCAHGGCSKARVRVCPYPAPSMVACLQAADPLVYAPRWRPCVACAGYAGAACMAGLAKGASLFSLTLTNQPCIHLTQGDACMVMDY